MATTAAQDLCRTGRHYARSSDRLGRSLRDLVAFLGELHAKGIDLYLHQQGIDTTTPAGKAMFQMMGVFAEFERAMIVERVKAGLARARAAGKRLGRPTIPQRKESGAGYAPGRDADTVTVGGSRWVRFTPNPTLVRSIPVYNRTYGR